MTPPSLPASAAVLLLAAASLPEGKILNLDKGLINVIYIQLFNVAVLIALLTFLLYKPVRKFLSERRQKIADDIERAQAIRDEAAQLQAKYKKMIDDIEAEREEILRLTHRKAVEKSDQLIFEARREAEAIFHRAKADMETERENLSNEMKRQIIEIAHLMAGRFVQLSIDRETQDRLIEQAFAEWEAGGETEAQNRINAEEADMAGAAEAEGAGEADYGGHA